MNTRESTDKKTNGVEEGHFIKLELKYCERCGGLWIRQQGGVESRCQKCVAEEGGLATKWRGKSHYVTPAETGAASGGESAKTKADLNPAAVLNSASMAGAIQL